MPDHRDTASLPADPAAVRAADPAANRAADHAGMCRLIDELLPALVAKLATLDVGELEVREGDWRIRLRRPADAPGPNLGRRASDRLGGRAHSGPDAIGTPAGPRPAHATPQPAGSAFAGSAFAESGNGSASPARAAVGPGRPDGSDGVAAVVGRDGARGPMATSPAVGIFQPGPKTATGTRIRAGERIGVVDMLGIPHDVTAPTDGIVVAVLADAGTAVEYGQQLVAIEPTVGAEVR